MSPLKQEGTVELDPLLKKRELLAVETLTKKAFSQCSFHLFCHEVFTEGDVKFTRRPMFQEEKGLSEDSRVLFPLETDPNGDTESIIHHSGHIGSHSMRLLRDSAGLSP